MAQRGGCLNVAAGGCLRAILGLVLFPVLIISGIFLVLNLERVFTHEPIEAVVVDLIASTDSEGDVVYSPVYEYQVEGATYRYTSAVSLGGVLVPDIGDTKTLLYDADDPGNARVRNYFILLGLPALGVVIPLGILALLGWAALRRRRRTVNEAATAVPAWAAPQESTLPSQDEPAWAPPVAITSNRRTIQATFMGTEPSQMDATGNVRYRVKARVEIDGVMHRFVGDWLDEDPTLLFMEQGNKVEVRIDPTDPSDYEVVMPSID